MAHVGQELRFGSVCRHQLAGSFGDPVLQRDVQVLKPPLGLQLGGVPGGNRFGHVVEGHAQPADFRQVLFDPAAGRVVAVTPFASDLQQILDRLLDEDLAARPGGIHRQQKSNDNQYDPAAGDLVDRRERGGLRFAGAEEEIARRQRRGQIAEDPLHPINALGFFPAGLVTIHDLGVTSAHVLAHQRGGVRQTGDDVAFPIGDQDRLGGRQAAFLQMVRQPVQIQPGEHHAGQCPVGIAVPQPEMNLLVAAGRINPVVANREVRLRYRPLEERHIDNGR